MEASETICRLGAISWRGAGVSEQIMDARPELLPHLHDLNQKLTNFATLACHKGRGCDPEAVVEPPVKSGFFGEPRMFSRKSFLKAAVAVAMTLGVTGMARAELTGAIAIDGSSTVYPITEGVSEEFKKVNKDVRVTVGISGTGGGFKRFVKGETDISNASRPIKKEEHDEAVKAGVEYIEIPVAYDGLSVVVNKSNTAVDKLTVDQLKKIYLEGGAKTWKDLDPSWPDAPLKIFSPGTDSGTFDYMKEVVTKGVKDGKVRADMQVSEDDNVLVTGVSGDQFAIGYFGSSYYFENKDKLRAVPIVNKKGVAVEPSAESINDGSYNPLSRPLFIYVNKKSMNKPEVKAFVEFYLENAAKISDEVGYVHLPDELYDRAEANVKAGKTGTQFLTDEGKHKDGALADVYK
jgi:phosphate transport system substrate-binding protein